MTKKTINQLPGGENIKNNSGVVAFEQNGVTYSGTLRSLAENLIPMKNEAQLETQLGPDLEIPDGAKFTLVLDSVSYIPTKPFKIGLGSVLEIYTTSIEATIDTTGMSEPLFVHLNPVNDVRALIVHNIFFKGDGTQPLCKLKGTSRVFFDDCRAEGFAGMELEFPGVNLGPNFAVVNWEKGIIVKNPSNLFADKTNLRQPTSKGPTFISVITNVPSKIKILNCPESILFPEDSFLHIDKNAPAGTNVKINGNSISNGNFYQKGKTAIISTVLDIGGDAVFGVNELHNLALGDKITQAGFTTPEYNGDFIVTEIFTLTQYKVGLLFSGADTGTLLNRPVNIASVADNGSGFTRFTTNGLPHNLRVGQVITLRNFATYNQTAIVTAVDTPITGTTFDADITFVATETGIADAASLDQTSSLVTAKDNPGQPNSMAQGESLVKSAGIVVADSATPVPLEDLTPAAGDWTPNVDNELMTLNTATGELEYIGTETIRVVPTYTIVASKVGGGQQVLEFALFRDKGSGYLEVPHTRIMFDVSIEASKLLPGTFFNADPGDKFKLFKVSNTASSDTNIEDGTQLMMLGET